MNQKQQRLHTLINHFAHARVLCVGDIMLDEYITGEANRISPEAPVPVIHHKLTKQVLGGVGNVAANLTALGCQTCVFYAVGKDSDAAKIEAMLTAAGVTPYAYAIAPLTTKKQRIIAQKQQVCRVDFEQKLQLSRPQEEEIIYHITSLLPQYNVVILSDYNKGLLSLHLTQRIIQAAKAQRIPILIDPKGHDYKKYQGATLIKPNFGEFKTAIRNLLPQVGGLDFINPSTPNGIKDVQLLAQQLKQLLKIDQFVITLGENGMIGIDTNQSIYQPTSKRAVSDVSGAGDTSLSLLAATKGAQGSLQDALELANLGAGVVVAKEGTAILSRTELKKALSEKASPLPSPVVLPPFINSHREL